MRAVAELARELAGVAENPVEALEELTGGKMLLILLGVGIVGGGLYYLATRPAAAIVATPGVPGATATATRASATSPPPPNAPLTTATAVTSTLARLTQPVVRPTAPGTFAATIIPVPAGPNLTVAPFSGVTQVFIPPGGYMTLTLPSGARFNSISLGQGQIDLSSDMMSPVSIPLSSITTLGATTIVVSWTDASGASQNSLFAPATQKVIRL